MLKITSFPYLDIIDVSKLDFGTRVIIRFLLDGEIYSRRVKQYNIGNSVEEIYEASGSLFYNDVHTTIKCYVKIPRVQRNAVGIIVAEEAYIIAFFDQLDFDRFLPLYIKEINLLKLVDNLPT